MNTTQQSCLPVEVLTALYRRTLAQAYLDACTAYGVETGYSLDELQMTIAHRKRSRKLLCPSARRKAGYGHRLRHAPRHGAARYSGGKTPPDTAGRIHDGRAVPALSSHHS